jgi:membrane protein insertase Oxa1/YidC/SpoIIIJ
MTQVGTSFLGMDLLAKNNVILTLLAGFLVWAQSSLMKIARPQQTTPQTLPNGQPAPDMSKMMGFMNIFMVLMMGGLVWTMQNGVGLYIVTTTLFSVMQYGWKYRSLLEAKTQSLFGKSSTPKPEIIGE